MVAEKQICHLRDTLRGPGGHDSMPHWDGAAGRMASFLRRFGQRRLPVHVTPVTRSMVETISSKLAWRQGMVFRRLLKPQMTDTALGLMGDKGESFEPLLRNTANPTVIRAGEQINVASSKVGLDLDGRLLSGYSPEDLISELVAISGGELELEVIRHDPGPSEPEFNCSRPRRTSCAQSNRMVSRYRSYCQGLPRPSFLQAGYTDVWLPADEAAAGS